MYFAVSTLVEHKLIFERLFVKRGLIKFLGSMEFEL